MSSLPQLPSGRLAGHRRAGLTLIELVVVLVILVALAGILVPLLGGTGSDARDLATRTTLRNVARAISGPGGSVETMRFATDDSGDPFGQSTGLPWPGPDEVTDGLREDHPQLHFLFVPPLSSTTPPALELDYDALNRVGWNGPYLDASAATTYQPAGLDASFVDTYGLPGDRAPIDAWGNPVVIQLPNSPLGDPIFARLVSAGPNGVIDTMPGTEVPVVTGDDLLYFLFRENPTDD